MRLDNCSFFSSTIEAAMCDANLSDEKLVLVVDDDSSARESMAEILDAKGYCVLQAENGQRALEVLKKMPHFPCLVLLDLAMPVMDGREFLKHRSQDSILRDIPVVVVSGNARTDEPPNGVCAYLCKPVNLDRLIEVIEQHC
jgi:CheY-like chemotaxis protein